jgi:hypothetical protein
MDGVPRLSRPYAEVLMARIITGVLERVDPDQQVVLVGAVVLRGSRQELIHGLKEGMRVRVRCEQSGDETWATAVTPVMP